jgi:hypothetical protein
MKATLWIMMLLWAAVITGQPAVADNPRQSMSFAYFPAGSHGLPALHEAVIQADGILTADSADEFAQFYRGHHRAGGRTAVYLTSPGGNLRAAIDLGYFIREHDIDTVVAATTPVSVETRQILRDNYHIIIYDSCSANGSNLCFGEYASYCISACTIAFLGGVHRSLAKGSSFAVHQYSAECKENQTSPICRDAERAMAEAQKMSADLAVYLQAMGIRADFLSDMVGADPKHVNDMSWRYLELELYNIVTHD